MRLRARQAVTRLPQHTGRELALAWLPYLLLVGLRARVGRAGHQEDHRHTWTNGLLTSALSDANLSGLNGIAVPGLRNLIQRAPPVTGAVATFNWLSASGTACSWPRSRRHCSSVSTWSGGQYLLGHLGQLSMITIAGMLALACDELLGHDVDPRSGACVRGPRVSVLQCVVGWMQCLPHRAATTSANALFGNLQVVTANALGLESVLTASVQLCGRCHGQDDLHPEHRGGRGCHEHDGCRRAGCSGPPSSHGIVLMAAMGVLDVDSPTCSRRMVLALPPKQGVKGRWSRRGA